MQPTIKTEDQAILNSIPDNQKEVEYIEVGVRPWGIYYVLEDKPNYKVKKMKIGWLFRTLVCNFRLTSG